MPEMAELYLPISLKPLPGFRLGSDNKVEDPRRFTLLPHFPGRKFTLGKEFKSREEQGEFVCCPFPHVAKSHCEIICNEDGTYSIKHLRNGLGTFVNKVKLNVDQEKVLEFGDVIGLGRIKPRKREKGKKKRQNGFGNNRPVKFVFQRAWPDKNDEDNEEDKDHNVWDPVSKALTNPLIISNIQRFLPISNLKMARLVSTHWRDAASTRLKKNTIFEIPFALSDYNDANEISARLLNYFHHSDEVNQNQLRLLCWNISFPFVLRRGGGQRSPGFGGLRVNVWNIFERLYLTRDGDHSISEISHHPGVKELKIFQSHPSKQESKYLSSFLKNDAFKGLEYLAFHVVLEDRNTFVRLKLPRTLSSGVKKLGLQFYYPEHQIEDGFYAQFKAWNFQLLSQFQGLEELELTSENTYDSLSALKYISEGGMPHLTSLLVRGTGCDPVDIKCILNLKGQSLKTLGLVLSNEFTSFGDREVLEDLLKKHDQSLNTLRLELPYESESEDGTFIFAIPALKNLKTLSIFFRKLVGTDINGGIQAAIQIQGPLIYEEKFASLQSLCVLPVPMTYSEDSDYATRRVEPNDMAQDWNKVGHVLQLFFPPGGGGGQVCKGVVHLELPYDGEACELDRLKDISKMFPSVHIPVLEMARKEEGEPN